MRRILTAILCIILLTLPVSAASRVSELQTNASVSSDGSSRVTVTVTLILDEAPASPVFPLPQQARDITLNGSAARTQVSGGVRNVNLSGILPGPGTYTFTVQYSLPNVVQAEEEELTLSVDLMTGFSYPVENMRFSVTLPDAAEGKPSFTSSYLMENVETVLDWKQEGTIISGSVTQRLQDRESLTMTLPVSEEMFPQALSKELSVDIGTVGMAACAIAALAYWLLTMRCLPVRRTRRTKAPEGLTAGELGCCLTGRGVDFTMMVISWAQMGYLLLQLDDNGRVLLHKRMEMGNERSKFEIRYFRSLFGKRKIIDGSGYHYARLCLKAKSTRARLHNYYLHRSGNPRILRVLSAMAGIFGGISMAGTFAGDTFWQVPLSVLLSAVGVGVCWQLQSALQCLHLRDKTDLWLGILCALLWVLLCSWAGAWDLAAIVLILEPLTGIAAAYGGRRTELGRQDMADILGLRRFLCHIESGEFLQVLRQNPNYYYDMAPYALALGVDRAFARRLGSYRLPECAYLKTGMDGHHTAQEWNRLLRETAASLDERQKRLRLDRLMGK